jgi:hypothetical protein
VQVVGHDRLDPALLLAARGEVSRQALTPGTKLDYTVGDRWCAGAVSDGEHHRCDDPRAPYCPAHTDTWVCATCTGDCGKPIENCDRTHQLYLAAFAPDTFKVGVTRAGRLADRLREQGADVGAHIGTFADGRLARQREAVLARTIGDVVRTSTKMEGLHRTVDRDAWSERLAAFDPETTYDLEYDLDLRDRPVRETLASGRVRGTKGRILVVERAGGTYAVDLRDLLGHELQEGASSRTLQSNLGAF